MLYYFRHALAVNVEYVCTEPVEVGDFLFWFVIFFGLVLKLQIGIHRSRNRVSYLKSRVIVTEAERGC